MNEILLSTVQDLVGVSTARRIGYENVLSKINNPELIEKIKKYIEQSEVFVKDLISFFQGKYQIETLPELVKPVHNEWLKVGSVIQDNTAIILSSCLEAEKITIKAFQSSLKEILPINIQNIVLNELKQIELIIKYFKDLLMKKKNPIMGL